MPRSFSGALRAASPGPDARSSHLVVGRLVIRVSPGGSGPALISGSPAILVRGIDPDDRGAEAVAARAACYALSPAGTRVLHCIARGQRVPSAATAPGLAPSTIKSQLAQVFRRTDTGSQADLVRLVAVMPPA